jgi:intracellular multiplication protein IcmQ
MMNSKDVLEIIEKFEETIAKWPQNGGMFVDLMGEKLKQIEKEFLEEIAAQIPAEHFHQEEKTEKTVPSGTQEVYVTLYQMDGNNMARWALTLGAIAIQGISRPIYENENDALNMIHHREAQEKEGYAVVQVPAVAIVKPATTHQDKLGQKLLHVKPGALKADNITRFVHISGQYAWQKNQLVKMDMPSPIKRTL